MASDRDAASAFAGIDFVVNDEKRFIAALGIGEDAYSTLKLGRTVGDLVSLSSGATVGASIAASSPVAATFFGGTGWLAALGLAPAAVTPIGWVVGAAVVTGAAYYGVLRAYGAYKETLVETAPRFINTPIDLLGAALVDMMGAIALRVALADGAICDRERQHIRDYFAETWGIDSLYAAQALAVLESNLAKATLEDQAATFAGFVRANPDCSVRALNERVEQLLTDLAEADGTVTIAERAAIRRVGAMLSNPDRVAAAAAIRQSWLGRMLNSLDQGTSTSSAEATRPSEPGGVPGPLCKEA